MKHIPLFALTAAAALAGCASERQTPSRPSMPTVTFTTSDFRFDGPTRVEAGVTTVRLVNQGPELHHVQLVRLEEDKRVGDLLETMKTPGMPPAWAVFVGGPNAVAPGDTTYSVQDLAPGRYATICIIPSKDGVPHFAKGMAGEFEVVPASGAGASEPAADVVLELFDYSFSFSQPITPGHRVIKAVNRGPQPHEVVVFKLAPGKTVHDVLAWIEGGEQGPPPAELLGGVVALSNGRHALFGADFTPGEYALVCFLPDVQDGKPHLAHGMVQQFTVAQ
ncbi:MAG TPA: hypothetical protein VNK43_11075 [Gemmatimonadales bacterium]|nr:hypothetical protein [Gemmatimonadales bacterium]